jgi:uncharacterized protein (DUF1697 family)
LLRGINVAGKNRLPMKDLVGFFTRTGCTDATAYIQSGNIIFRAPPKLISRVSSSIEKAIREEFGYAVPVILRSAEEMSQVVKRNPFLRAGADEASLYVAFLADSPSAARIASLDPDRSPPDELAVIGRDVYLRLPNGAGRTKLTNDYLDRTLATTSTVRNWRTVLKLVDMSKTCA